MSQYSKEDDAIITAMETYGGSFVKALAECFRRADQNNYLILQQAFGNYWYQYAEMANKPNGKD